MSSFDMEKLQAAFDRLREVPPAPMLAASKWFPSDRAISFTVERVQYVGAHPSFWDRVPKIAEDRACLNPLARLQVFDLDTDGRARRRWFDALARALDKANAVPKPWAMPSLKVHSGIMLDPGA